MERHREKHHPSKETIAPNHYSWEGSVVRHSSTNWKVEEFWSENDDYSDHKTLVDLASGKRYHWKPPEYDQKIGVAYAEPVVEVIAQAFADYFEIPGIDTAFAYELDGRIGTCSEVVSEEQLDRESLEDLVTNTTNLDTLMGQAVLRTFLNDRDWGINKWGNYSVHRENGNFAELRTHDFSHMCLGPFGLTWASDERSYAVNVDDDPKNQGFGISYISNYISRAPHLLAKYIIKLKLLSNKKIHCFVRAVVDKFIKDDPKRKEHYERIVVPISTLLIIRREPTIDFFEKLQFEGYVN